VVYENLGSSWKHVVCDPPDYYFFDHILNKVNLTNTKGVIGFTWPIIGNIVEKEISYAVYDGFYYWTLQRMTTGAQIKKFIKDPLFFTETKSYLFTSTTQSLNTTFDVNCFFVESYNTTITGSLPKNSTVVALTDYAELIVPGTSLYLGPNTNGEYENLTVTGTVTTESGTYLGFNFYTYYNYENGDPAYFSNRFGLFNAYQGTVLGGSLYTFNTEDFNFIDRYDDSEFSNVSCCAYAFFNEQPRLFYVKQATLYLRNMDFSLYTTMVLDNTSPAPITTLPIYSLSVHDTTIFRYQKSANYFGTLYNWATYNFQFSTLVPFVDSTTMSAWPKILPSNGINITKISLVAQDQFGNPLVFSKVTFTDDDVGGYITRMESYTDTTGIAINHYRSGTIPRTVNLTGSVMTIINV